MEDIRKTKTYIGRGKEAEAGEWLRIHRPEFRTIERNFRRSCGEIDLIGEEGSDLVFVEIRWRSPGAQVDALESITQSKRRKILRTARAYLINYRGRATATRFDVLTCHSGQWRYMERAFEDQ